MKAKNGYFLRRRDAIFLYNFIVIIISEHLFVGSHIIVELQKVHQFTGINLLFLELAQIHLHVRVSDCLLDLVVKS